MIELGHSLNPLNVIGRPPPARAAAKRASAAQSVAATALAAFAVWLAAMPTAASAQLVEGRDYVVLAAPQPTSHPEQVVVTEFFSYQCPHCYAFHPALEAWTAALPDDVVFERVPVSLGREARAPVARAFYALVALGEAERLDAPLFRAIHVERGRLYDEAAVTDWVAGQGVDRGAFTSAYRSFSVSSFFTRGEQTSRAHRIPSVPTLVVDGRYLVAIVDDGTFEAQLERVGALVARARAERVAAR